MAIKVINLDDCPLVNAQGYTRVSIFGAHNASNKISLEYVMLPKGDESVPHAHIGTHTVVYTIQGTVRIYFGDQLENQVVAAPKDCVYIPPGVIHYVVNEHEEDMVAIVARTPYLHQVEEYGNLLKLITSH